ncbi:MAG: presqualene diphosphate synthase HpnD [Janthinobacterium lividum]
MMHDTAQAGDTATRPSPIDTPPLPTDASVEQWSGKDRGDENFPVGVLIRASLRPHVHAYYAFARNADDISDSETLPAVDKVARLDHMQAVLLGQADAGAPSATALRRSLAATGVTSAHSTDLLVAFRRDASTLRTADWPELLEYCRFSAMPVGRHVLDLHGEDRATFAPSDALCAALQVLNHLQDCAEDLRRLDRSYLPQDLLARHGATVEDVLLPAATPGLRAVFDALLDRCDALNQEAAALPRLVRDPRLRLETAVIVALSRRLARHLRRADPVAGRVKLGRADAAGSLLRALPSLLPPRRATPLGAAPSDLAEVERLVLASGTSFYRGMKVLPPDRRAAMYAIYAFCRVVDDIADDEAPFATKLPRLAQWRARIDAVLKGRADDAVSRVLLAATDRFGLRREDFMAVIDGMQTDCETVIVAPSEAELDLYCDRVAAAVGRLSVRAFGDSSPAADQVAWSLGRALQMTNILRDVAEDAERGRLYLPREWLDAEGVPHDPALALRHPALPRVCARGAVLAHRRFADAREAMRACDRRAMRPARLMADTYDAILSRLEQRGWQHPERRVSLPAWRKLAIALRHVAA